jgi:hypothetical protein
LGQQGETSPGSLVIQGDNFSLIIVNFRKISKSFIHGLNCNKTSKTAEWINNKIFCFPDISIMNFFFNKKMLENWLNPKIY